ncbi:MAG TPA: peroxiredoxin [Pelagibacteraceae bacterium]|jgi:peroxiredoxin (alkyl hydroperoxide reductase subunit C)|nr:peroxiredoxin [Pelagibacteraceae bacterium]
MKIKKGDKLPDAKVFILEKDPKEVSIKKIVGNEKVILFGLPGAFTPTCSAKHLPGFIIAIDQLKKKGIKKVVCISVNDPFVMDAWGKTHNVQDKILMVGDSKGDFTKNIGAELNLTNRGLGVRSSRYTMLVEKGSVLKISEEEVAGKCEVTAAENFLKEI